MKDIWTKLAQPISSDSLTAAQCRQKLDEVVPGEWDLTLELLPEHAQGSANSITFKARLQILGVIRESASNPGMMSYVAAAASGFVNAAALFGICVTLPSGAPQ